MHTDGAFRLPTTAEQIAQGKMQVSRFRIQLHNFNESINRLVRLFIQQEVQPLEIPFWQAARFRQQLFDIDTGSNPSKTKENGNADQPPDFKFHKMMPSKTITFRRRMPDRPILCFREKDIVKEKSWPDVKKGIRRCPFPLNLRNQIILT